MLLYSNSQGVASYKSKHEGISRRGVRLPDCDATIHAQSKILRLEWIAQRNRDFNQAHKTVYRHMAHETMKMEIMYRDW